MESSKKFYLNCIARYYCPPQVLSRNNNHDLCIYFHVTWVFSLLRINKLNSYKSGLHNDFMLFFVKTCNDSQNV